MYFFVKARVDVKKLGEYGQKLQNGEFSTHPLSTYCLMDEPSVGLNIWEADNKEHFENSFLLHRKFYSEIIEIAPVILPLEAMKKLMSGNAE